MNVLKTIIGHMQQMVRQPEAPQQRFNNSCIASTVLLYMSGQQELLVNPLKW